MPLSGGPSHTGPSNVSAQPAAPTPAPSSTSPSVPTSKAAIAALAQLQPSLSRPHPNGAANFPRLSATTEEILKRVSANGGAQPGWEAMREQVLQGMVTTQDIPTPPPMGSSRGKGRGAGASGVKMETPRRGSTVVAGSPPTSGRGRGGRGRGGGGRGGKRKRVKKDEDEDNGDPETTDVWPSGMQIPMKSVEVAKSPELTPTQDSAMSEEITSLPTKTKSGRKVHRPAQFDPATKTPTRRRGPYRRLAEATVCRVCQRGHSPARNMIVFCDGCNKAYHQYCHNPPIEDEVVKVEEKEWQCSDCTDIWRNELLGGLAKGESRPAVAGQFKPFEAVSLSKAFSVIIAKACAC